MSLLTARQRQLGNTTVYLALAAILVVGVGIAVYLMSKSAQQSELAVLPSEDQPLLSAEPPAITTVDMQQAEIDDTAARQARPKNPNDRSKAGDLFASNGRKIPLEDGLAGGSEALPNGSSSTGRRSVHAVDAFDYGVLDGRVRVGVFGKGPIADYRVSLNASDYVIDMPGEFRYLDEFSQALIVGQFGVKQARLERTARGMRMRIDVTPGLQHKPFLIEDPKGLIIAFEPKG